MRIETVLVTRRVKQMRGLLYCGVALMVLLSIVQCDREKGRTPHPRPHHDHDHHHPRPHHDHDHPHPRPHHDHDHPHPRPHHDHDHPHHHDHDQHHDHGHHHDHDHDHDHHHHHHHDHHHHHHHDRGHGHEGHHHHANGSLKIFRENLEFAFHLYKHISALPDSQSKNVFFSPLSVSVALAALSLGARGKTHQQLFEGLGFNATEITADEVNQAFLHIHENLNAKTDVDLSLGNALFIAQDFKVRPEFLESMKHYFQSEGFSTDFSDTEAAKEQINKYVDEKTKGKITDLVEDVDSETVMYLINYIYFKGKWDIPFDPKETKEDQFNVDDKTTMPVQMMHKEDFFHIFYDNESSAHVLQLHYNESVSMMLVLPKKGLKSLEDVVCRHHLRKWIRSAEERKYDVYVPKLSLKTSYQLKDILSGMGITDIFEETANFTGITETEKLVVSKVTHKATLDMDEAGATAAAATGIEIMLTSSRFQPPVLKFDRPFMIFVLNRETRSLLFMGKIENPGGK
ncbi:hypothetical protein GJAV_G00023300 [Gymnothorax javanicus]|nr:hypothetical protein GJAV_G00023300 [Gymnothorax javanicus]